LLFWLFCQIKRLREEGSKLLKEQQELLKAQLRKEMESGQDETKSEEATPKLKVHMIDKSSALYDVAIKTCCLNNGDTMGLEVIAIYSICTCIYMYMI